MQDKQLIFLISLPRSGSTMLQKMLGAHSQIYTRSEPWVMLHPMTVFKEDANSASYNHSLSIQGTKDFFTGMKGDMGEERYFSEIGEAYLKFYGTYLEDSGADYFLDKTPRYFHIFDELKTTYKNAKFIILKRNPLAVLSSILDTWVKDEYYKLSSYKFDLDDGVESLSRDFSGLENCFEVQYENLLRDPDSVMNTMCKFLGIQPEASSIEYGTNNQEKWLFGDQGTVYKKKGPDASHADRWVEGLSNEIKRRLLNEYLERIGEDGFSAFGYDYQANKKEVTAVRSKSGSQKHSGVNLAKSLDRDIALRNEQHESELLKMQQEYDALLSSSRLRENELSEHIHTKHQELLTLRDEFSDFKKEQELERIELRTENEANHAKLSRWVHEKQEELITLRTSFSELKEEKAKREESLSNWVHSKQNELVEAREQHRKDLSEKMKEISDLKERLGEK